MDISNDLIDAFGQEIADTRSHRFRNFSTEGPIIKATIDVLDDICVEVDADGGQSLWTITKQMHHTPQVEFFWPARWEKTRAELADLLFLLTVYEDESGPVDRRTILSQAKHSKRENHYTKPSHQSTASVEHLPPPPYSWSISPHQYYLLENLPYFKPTKPAIDKVYHLSPTHQSFTTYSFASDFWLPSFILLAG